MPVTRTQARLFGGLPWQLPVADPPRIRGRPRRVRHGGAPDPPFLQIYQIICNTLLAVRNGILNVCGYLVVIRGSIAASCGKNIGPLWHNLFVAGPVKWTALALFVIILALVSLFSRPGRVVSDNVSLPGKEQFGVISLTPQSPIIRICSHHRRLARLNPAAEPPTMFGFLGIDASVEPFSNRDSDFPNGHGYTKVRTLIAAAGTRRIAQAIRSSAGGDKLEWRLASITTHLLLNDEIRATYFDQFLPKLQGTGGWLSWQGTRKDVLKEICG
ncbi:hypothetical protein G7046_g7064 [Stylonectria norvegica]|nr:hypothetical protein G7046_g7064 [Stylonectria norvegica]